MGNGKRKRTGNEYDIQPGESQKAYYKRLAKMKTDAAIEAAKANGTYLDPAVIEADQPYSIEEVGPIKAWFQRKKGNIKHHKIQGLRRKGVLSEETYDDYDPLEGFTMYDQEVGPNYPVLLPLNGNAAFSVDGTLPRDINGKPITMLLGNDYIQPGKSPFTAGQIKAMKDDDAVTWSSDTPVPKRNIKNYYGIVDGSLKMGPLDLFSDDTYVVPVRNKIDVGIQSVDGIPEEQFIQEYEKWVNTKDSLQTVSNNAWEKYHNVRDSLNLQTSDEFRKAIENQLLSAGQDTTGISEVRDPRTFIDSYLSEALSNDIYNNNTGINFRNYQPGYDYLYSRDGALLAEDTDGLSYVVYPRLSNNGHRTYQLGKNIIGGINKMNNELQPYIDNYVDASNNSSDWSKREPTAMHYIGTDGNIYNNLLDLGGGQWNANIDEGNKVLLGNENGGFFTASLSTALKNQMYRDMLNSYLSQYGPLYPISIDNGGYYKYQINKTNPIDMNTFNQWHYEGGPGYIFGATPYKKNGGILKRIKNGKR